MNRYPRTPHLSQSQGKTRDDLTQFDLSKIIGSKVVLLEKLDGQNTVLTSEGIYSRNMMDKAVGPTFNHLLLQWVTIKDKLYEWNVQIMGENLYAVHSIEYNSLNAWYYIFGARNLNGNFHSWDVTEKYSGSVGFPTVPVLDIFTPESEQELYNRINELMATPSQLGGIKEGIVIRKYDHFSDEDFPYCVVKYVRKDHVASEKHWNKGFKVARRNY